MSNSTTLKRLRDFKLAGIAKTLDIRLAQALDTETSYPDFLDLLLADEYDNRLDNRNKKQFSKAHFPYVKGLEEFDFAFQPSLKKAQILELATGSFLTKKENLILIGPPGVGKTHLSISLGLKALEMGRSVLFTTVWDMITSLEQSRADFSFRRKIDSYLKPDLLILDELGYKTIAESTVEDFFEIISKRYEKGSVIITSNRDIAEWDKIFIDKTLTGAIIDRLIHHCHTFVIAGDSYRFKNRTH